jgi:hypothetical protein
MDQVEHGFSCNPRYEQGTIAMGDFAASQLPGEPRTHFKSVLTISSSSYLLKGAVATIRSFFSILVFMLLLCTLFPAGQIGWSFNSLCDSTGDTGRAQACDFSDGWEAADFEDDSPQEANEGRVTFHMGGSDCESSRSHASIDEIPPSTLFVSQLLHPPTAHS